MRCKERRKVRDTEDDPIDDHDYATVTVRCNPPGQPVVQHPIVTRGTGNVARGQAAIHLLPQSTKGVVWGGLAICRELISGSVTPFLRGPYRKAEADIITRNHAAPRATSVV